MSGLVEQMRAAAQRRQDEAARERETVYLDVLKRHVAGQTHPDDGDRLVAAGIDADRLSADAQLIDHYAGVRKRARGNGFGWHDAEQQARQLWQDSPRLRRLHPNDYPTRSGDSAPVETTPSVGDLLAEPFDGKTITELRRLHDRVRGCGGLSLAEPEARREQVHRRLREIRREIDRRQAQPACKRVPWQR